MSRLAATGICSPRLRERGSRHPLGSLTVLLMALGAALIASGVLASAAAAATRSFAPVKHRHGVLTFRLKGVEPKQIRAGRLVVRGHRYKVGLRHLRSGARRGLLHVRLTRDARKRLRGRRGKVRLVLTLQDAGRAPPAVGNPIPDPTIAAAGDIACGPTDMLKYPCQPMATSDLLLRLAPQAVLALGDNQYEARLDNFMRFYDPSWGRLKAITYPVLGNHEYGNSGATCGYACGYFDYFDGVGSVNGRAGTRGEGFYAFDLGAWRLYALNSNCLQTGAPSCAVGSPQESWFRSDLAAHPTQCALLFMHHPLFTSDQNPTFDDPTFRAALRPLWQAFYDSGGDVVLVGHSHFYERYAPQTPSAVADPARGIRQFIVGTGGRNTFGFGPIEPNSEVRITGKFGVLKMTLHPASYDWSFITAPAGAVEDSGSQQCHA